MCTYMRVYQDTAKPTLTPITYVTHTHTHTHRLDGTLSLGSAARPCHEA